MFEGKKIILTIIVCRDLTYLTIILINAGGGGERGIFSSLENKTGENGVASLENNAEIL